MSARTIASILALSLLWTAPVSAAPLWTVDTASSHLTFTGKQGGKEFTGAIKTFTPVIAFDAKDLATSSIKVHVDTASAVTGDKALDTPLPTSEWFNVAKFPEAVFESKTITAKDATHFEAMGTLTMLGVTKDITLPFTLVMDGKNAHATGQTSLKRLDFGLGQGVDAKGDTVANDVTITVDITAHP